MSRTLQEPTFKSSVTRNVHLYDDNGMILGGIYQNGSLTHRHLYYLCPLFLEFSLPNTVWQIFTLNDDGSTGHQLANDATNVAPGRYIILGLDGAPVSVLPSTDSFPRRILSLIGSTAKTPRRKHFQGAIRSRDSYCMLSGRPNPGAVLGDFVSFEAGHIFPFAREGDWRSKNFQRFITDNSPASCIGTSKIHSPQNGFLMSSGLHVLFLTYRVSVNPDDNYRITAFLPDWDGVDGRTLEFPCRDPNGPNRVSDDLLRWHFRMSVLANMRGVTTEPTWEMDFPEGDMMGEIMEGPHAAERMELELIDRLGPGDGVY